MKTIDRKLWRDLWRLRAQALAIALVIACGVAMFVMSLSTLDSMYQTRETYYRDHGFADVFGALKRAPETLVQRIRNSGVAGWKPAWWRYVNIDIAGFAEPITPPGVPPRPGPRPAQSRLPAWRPGPRARQRRLGGLSPESPPPTDYSRETAACHHQWAQRARRHRR